MRNKIWVCVILFFLLWGCSKKEEGVKPAKHSFDPEVAYQRAKEYESNFQFEKARKLFEKVVDNTPKGSTLQTRARVHLGKIYYWCGDYEPAIREFKKALDGTPLNPAAVKSNLVLSYLASDRPNDALKYVSSEIDPYSKWKTHYSFLAQIRYAQFCLYKDFSYLSKLKEELKRGIDETSDPFAKRMMLASLHLFQGEYESVLEDLTLASKMAQNPKDEMSILFLCGALSYRQGNVEKARQFFKRVISKGDNLEVLDPKSFMDWFYSYWFIHRGKMDVLAISSAMEKVEGGFGDPEGEAFIKFIKGYAEAYREGKWDEALSYTKKMEASILDESTEGDFFYDGVYKPFILSLLYLERASIYRKLGKVKDSTQALDKAGEILHSPFPQKVE